MFNSKFIKAIQIDSLGKNHYCYLNPNTVQSISLYKNNQDLKEEDFCFEILTTNEKKYYVLYSDKENTRNNNHFTKLIGTERIDELIYELNQNINFSPSDNLPFAI